MDTLLLIITIASLAAAFVAAMAVRKLKQADRLRSDARVAALMAAADGPAAAAATSAGWNSVSGEMRWGAGPAPIRESNVANRESRTPSNRVIDPESQIPAASVNEERFFGTVQREQPASGRFAIAAACALLVAVGGAVIVFSSSSHEKAAAPAAQAAHASPLELISLGHSRDAGTLTINGVVRNPAGGPKLEELTAVVSLIDEHGGLISSKDVPLDYRALGPGEEAPFKITVPDPGSIARYRVSFRAGSDVIPHVDRRTDAKLASAL